MSERERLETRYAAHHAGAGRYGFSYRLDERGPALAAWIGRGRRVLDLGCRDGSLTRYYAPDNSVAGVDIDRAALARARETLGIETVWLNLNSEALPFPAETFDVVVAGEVLEHVLAPADIAAEARRVLVPGGQFVGSVPNSFHWRARLAFLGGQTLEDPTHLHLFSLMKVRTLLEGFASAEIVPIGTIGGRRIPQLPTFLARWLVRRWPTLFASDFLFHAQRART